MNFTLNCINQQDVAVPKTTFLTQGRKDAKSNRRLALRWAYGKDAKNISWRLFAPSGFALNLLSSVTYLIAHYILRRFSTATCLYLIQILP